MGVTVATTTVTLSGTVSSWSEYDEAEAAPPICGILTLVWPGITLVAASSYAARQRPRWSSLLAAGILAVIAGRAA